MPPSQPKGPFCQSCSMPLAQAQDFGTDRAGFRVNDYCRHCFANGEFTDPHISMAAMIDRCVGVMSQRGVMPEPQARSLLNDVMPRLKRWRVIGAQLSKIGIDGRTRERGRDESR